MPVVLSSSPPPRSISKQPTQSPNPQLCAAIFVAEGLTAYAVRPSLQKRRAAFSRNEVFTQIIDSEAKLAERGGFEPPVRVKRTLDFESSTFNLSDTSPQSISSTYCLAFLSSAKKSSSNFFPRSFITSG